LSGGDFDKRRAYKLENVETEILTREIALEDAKDAAELSTALGYPLTTEEMALRIEYVSRCTDLAVYVACLNGHMLGQPVAQTVGWIDIGIVRHLITPAYGEIGGLVVAQEYRSRGIGAQLVKRAEQWARERGVEKMLVRSRAIRKDAHRFYLRLGYSHYKTSEVFTKAI
jgi:GNAT superfamily N-acetyltransferase